MHRGWSYEAVLPYFKKSEHYEPGGDDTRGSSGPLNVAIIVAENRPVLVAAAAASCEPAPQKKLRAM